MGLWLDILKLGASGDSATARSKLALDLPLALRGFTTSSQGSVEYRGVLPQAVRRFSAKLNEQDRAIISSYEREFVDYLVDGVVAGVEKTLALVELSFARPDSTLDGLVALFPWKPSLKRDAEQKRRWIVAHLRSMEAAGIALPEGVSKAIRGAGGEEGDDHYEFDEIAFAVAQDRLWKSWKDFKKKQDLDHRFMCVVESETSEDVAAEGFDYGAVAVANMLLQSFSTEDLETEIDLHLLGGRLSHELTALTESMHFNKPRDGYRPIAWHRVFWDVTSDYVRLQLTLEVHDPFLEKDQDLADYIKSNYTEVKGASRPVILRRRQNLSNACQAKIKAGFCERFGPIAEQRSPRITHDSEEDQNR